MCISQNAECGIPVTEHFYVKSVTPGRYQENDAGCAYVPGEEADNSSVPHQGYTLILLLYVLKAPAAGSLFFAGGNVIAES